MCIFSDQTIASETIIAVGYNHIAYQNKIEAPEETCMIMPVPGDEVTFGQLPAGALESLAKQWMEATNWHPVVYRGMKEALGVQQVGQYEVLVTDNPRLMLQAWGKPIYSWLDEVEKRYAGWSFVLVNMKPGTNIANQPWFVKFQPFQDKFLFAPMLDVHGDEPLTKETERNHLVLVQALNSDTFTYEGEVPEWQGNWDAFEWGYKSGVRTWNGDLRSKNPTTMGVWRY